MTDVTMDRAEKFIGGLEPDEHFGLEDEIAAFIRRPELRSVARDLLNLEPSFSRASALRKLLEADEALGRAGALHIAITERRAKDAAEKTAKESGEP